ncbi:MAG: glycosyltransferase family protein [Selenomonadaceae bacterium]|nr:glycosyltransferase family protein [Selenomonadaceae bacterium]MBR6711132.1 glycosyltransferase family protein [Selenomonadaceae bacterium]
MGGNRMHEGNPDKICFITCVNDEDWYSECLLYLQHLEMPEGMQAEYLPIRGAKSMCAGYNEGLRRSDAKYKVYLHQDTLVVNKQLVRDLKALFADESIGAVGVIGCRNLPRSGIWWDGMRTYGRVLHACEPESVVDSVGMQPEGAYMEVEAVDGLFIAMQYDIPWREELFTGWHLYDTSICKEVQRSGKRVVVPNQTEEFWCIHCPKEKPLASDYRGYQKTFLKEYGAELHPEV